MGVCLRCKQEKPDEDFAWRYKKDGIRQKACRSCMAQYHKENFTHWKKTRDPEVEKERQRIKIRRAREFVYQYKLTHTCVDCVESDPIYLDFDHVDKTGGYNVYTRIAKLVARGYSIERIEAEIKKCVVRCVRCHRTKTASEQNWYKGLRQGKSETVRTLQGA